MKTEIEPDFTQPQLSVLYKYCDLRKNTESTVQSYIKRVASVCSEHCVTSTKYKFFLVCISPHLDSIR